MKKREQLFVSIFLVSYSFSNLIFAADTKNSDMLTIECPNKVVSYVGATNDSHIYVVGSKPLSPTDVTIISRGPNMDPLVINKSSGLAIPSSPINSIFNLILDLGRTSDAEKAAVTAQETANRIARINATPTASIGGPSVKEQFKNLAQCDRYGNPLPADPNVHVYGMPLKPGQKPAPGGLPIKNPAPAAVDAAMATVTVTTSVASATTTAATSKAPNILAQAASKVSVYPTVDITKVHSLTPINYQTGAVVWPKIVPVPPAPASIVPYALPESIPITPQVPVPSPDPGFWHTVCSKLAEAKDIIRAHPVAACVVVVGTVAVVGGYYIYKNCYSSKREIVTEAVINTLQECSPQIPIASIINPSVAVEPEKLSKPGCGNTDPLPPTEPCPIPEITPQKLKPGCFIPHHDDLLRYRKPTGYYVPPTIKIKPLINAPVTTDWREYVYTRDKESQDQSKSEEKGKKERYDGPIYDRTEGWIKASPFGKEFERTRLGMQGKRAFRLKRKIPELTGIAEGESVVIDAQHKDHLEVYDKNNRWSHVANFDGTKNIEKSEHGKNEPRKPLHEL